MVLCDGELAHLWLRTTKQEAYSRRVAWVLQRLACLSVLRWCRAVLQELKVLLFEREGILDVQWLVPARTALELAETADITHAHTRQ